MNFGSLHEQYQIKIRKGKKKSMNFPALEGEESGMSRMRQELYKKDLDRLNDTVSGILKKHNMESVPMVIDFCKFEDALLIPTAVVQGGHAGSDKSIFYDQLIAEIAQPLCILDSSIDTIKDCLKKMNDEFVGKNQYCDFDIEKLVSWYKKSKERIILLIPDFEGFDSNVLQTLILILFARRHELQVTLILGVSTNRDALHQSLSKAAFSCLNTKLFKLTNSRVCLGDIVTDYFLHPAGMKLGSEPFQALLDRFIDRDLSVLSFVRGIKYALMCHYFGNPLSSLLHPKMANTQFSDVHIDHLRVLDSFKNRIKQLHDRVLRIQKQKNASKQDNKDAIDDRKEVHELLRDSEKLEEFTVKQLANLRDYNKRFGIVLKMLHVLPSLFKSNEVKKNIYYLYEVALSKDIMSNEYVRMWLALFKKLDIHVIRDYLVDLMTKLKEHEKLFENDIPHLQKKIENVEERIRDIGEGNVETAHNSEEEDYTIKQGLKRVQADFKTLRKTKVAKKAGTEMLQSNIPPKDKLLESIGKFMNHFFGTYLTTYDYIPLYEICYFVDPNVLISRTFHAEPRSMLFTALEAPHTYLQCECCKDHVMGSEMEDICVMYKLYQECGKLINLQDWYAAFKSIIDTDEQREPTELQARFVKSVTELQFLGFVKATGRKKDHVQRLTWGS